MKLEEFSLIADFGSWDEPLFESSTLEDDTLNAFRALEDNSEVLPSKDTDFAVFDAYPFLTVNGFRIALSMIVRTTVLEGATYQMAADALIDELAGTAEKGQERIRWRDPFWQRWSSLDDAQIDTVKKWLNFAQRELDLLTPSEFAKCSASLSWIKVNRKRSTIVL